MRGRQCCDATDTLVRRQAITHIAATTPSTKSGAGKSTVKRDSPMWPYDDSEADWLGATAPAVKAPAAATVVSLQSARSEAGRSAVAAAAPVTGGSEDEGGLVGRIIGRIRSWRERQDARSRLYAMSERELADIGLTRDAIDMAVGSADSLQKPTFDGVLGGAVHGLTRGATTWWKAA